MTSWNVPKFRQSRSVSFFAFFVCVKLIVSEISYGMYYSTMGSGRSCSADGTPFNTPI